MVRVCSVVVPATLVAVVSCSNGGGSGGNAGTKPESRTTSGGPGTDPSGGGTSGGPASGPDGGPGGDPGPPAVQLIGRFDVSNPASPKTAWPGGRIVARFDGTAVTAKLSQQSGFGGGNSWFNIIVDGAVTTQVEIAGAGQTVDVASGLSAGTHVVELEKRTEANLGTVTFDGFTFTGGTGLLPPPSHATRRIEFLADSTIDGYGIDGNVNGDCAGGDPPALNDVHKGTAAKTAQTLAAEGYVLAYSGKGIILNEDGDTPDKYPDIYGRTLPEVTASTWDFSSWTPDVVVISLGGTDISEDTAPAGFQAQYDAFVTQIRGRYPNAHIYMTVWSQIKDLGAGQNLRTALTTALDGIKSAHGADARLHVFSFKEADYPQDETGCDEHANDAHATETAAEIAATIKADLGW